MGIAKKVLKGFGSTFTTENTIANGGGLSSLLVPRKLNKKGGALLVGAVGAATMVQEGAKGNSKAKIGRVSYGESMSRMTGVFGTGAAQAMRSASGGDYEVFSDMASGVLESPNLVTQLDDFGANPAMISALYNMS